MPSKYAELLVELHDSTPQPNPRYYQLLIENAQLILLQISLKNQHIVSGELKMDRMRLSHLMPLLREVANV